MKLQLVEENGDVIREWYAPDQLIYVDLICQKIELNVPVYDSEREWQMAEAFDQEDC